MDSLLDRTLDWLGLREQEFQQDLQWSNEARALLDNPLLQRFFEETERHLMEQWQQTKPHEVDEREIAYRFLMLNRKFKQYFETFLAKEEYAKQQLAQMTE